jgi:protein-L-isoaspartate(D-aspartate) O-methyltransferase
MSADHQQSAETLRQQLVAYLKNLGHIQTSAVASAFQSVPRHVFVPGEDLQKVYSDTYILTKMQGETPISSSSQPAIMAIMLETLAVQPGQRVLEIGAGTGYNAALLAHIVGERGSVTAIDFDEDIAQAAREHLQLAGYPEVQVIQGDGVYGYPANAPYDRIILTASTADIAPAWWEQLKPGGRLVMPFKLTGLTHIPLTQSWLLADQVLLAFERQNDSLVSVATNACGFMPLRGLFAQPLNRTLRLVPEDGYLALMDGPGDLALAPQLFQHPGTDEILPLTLSDLELPGLRLWLALRDSAYCELYGQEKVLQPAGGAPLIRLPGTTLTAIGLYEDQGMGLLTRPPDLPDEVLPSRLTLRSFGDNSATAARLREHITAWDRAGRPFRWRQRGLLENVQVRVYPPDTTYLPGEHELMVARPNTRLVFHW